MIEEIKPAHLAVEYIFTYRLWQDILDEIQIWTAAKNYSWEWMLTFEVKFNLNISDGDIFYCPDRCRKREKVWNNNKKHMQEKMNSLGNMEGEINIMAEIHPNDIGLATFADVGDVEKLKTSAKNLVDALNEIYQNGTQGGNFGDK